MSEPVCRRCREPVEAGREQYDVFEQMHWVCFHCAFKHAGRCRPGLRYCGVPVSAGAGVHRAGLVAVLLELAGDWEAGAPADWGTADLGEFLVAVAARLGWLDNVEPPDTGRRPWSSWQQVAEALRYGAGVRDGFRG